LLKLDVKDNHPLPVSENSVHALKTVFVTARGQSVKRAVHVKLPRQSSMHDSKHVHKGTKNKIKESQTKVHL